MGICQREASNQGLGHWRGRAEYESELVVRSPNWRMKLMHSVTLQVSEVARNLVANHDIQHDLMLIFLPMRKPQTA